MEMLVKKTRLYGTEAELFHPLQILCAFQNILTTVSPLVASADARDKIAKVDGAVKNSGHLRLGQRTNPERP
jgi:hypothetical protein